MQTARARAEAVERKAKLARSYQELLDEFGSKDLKTVGNYALGRLIGKGSFGKVYLASHKLINGSKVVLKSANKTDSNLAREIHHHRQFVHPHIARLYEVVVTEAMVWLVLEYCSGDELYDYLLKTGPISVAKTQKIFTQLVGAVAYVHMQSCVHRDLKLENILLDKNENVKLVDFGFTREYEGKASYLQTFCGTICYSAPEMLKGEKYAGEKVDVWSLGIILYALLCGELPFDDDDDNVTRTKILNDEPKYPEFLPADAVSLIKLLLWKRPFRRPSLLEILAHPFLAEHAPQQQAILSIEHPAPFTTPVEQETLHRLKSAGVSTESVVESVMAQRCDSLAGWWKLLLEKEERKWKKREQRRKERGEPEKRLSRRLSGASSRVGPFARDLDEESKAGVIRLQNVPLTRPRGRSKRRSTHIPPDFTIADLQNLRGSASPELEAPPPPPVDKDSVRSVSTSRQRPPIPPPKESLLRSAQSRGSTLHLMTTGEPVVACEVTQESEQAHNTNVSLKVRKKPSQALLSHWRSWTSWLVEKRPRARQKRGGRVVSGGCEDPTATTTTTRATDAATETTRSLAGRSSQTLTSGKSQGTLKLANDIGKESPAAAPTSTPRTAFFGSPNGTGNGLNSGTMSSPGAAALAVPATPSRELTNPLGSAHARLRSSSSFKRQSLSPTPMTPRSSMTRRRTSGLRGRKSTSSSVSSIRSMHRSLHRHTASHSRASSPSSNGSVSTSLSRSTFHVGRSPHHTVKVLPATPTAAPFPPNLRLVRGPPQPIDLSRDMAAGKTFGGEGMPGSPIPFGAGAVAMASAFRSRSRGSFGASGFQLNSSTPVSAPSLFAPPPSTPVAGDTGVLSRPGASVLFAKRKRAVFKGPMMGRSGSIGTPSTLGGASNLLIGGGGGGGGGGGMGPRSGGHSRNSSTTSAVSASGLSGASGGQRSGDMAIQEEDEEEVEGGAVYSGGMGAAETVSGGRRTVDDMNEVDASLGTGISTGTDAAVDGPVSVAPVHGDSPVMPSAKLRGLVIAGASAGSRKSTVYEEDETEAELAAEIEVAHQLLQVQQQQQHQQHQYQHNNDSDITTSQLADDAIAGPSSTQIEPHSLPPCAPAPQTTAVPTTLLSPIASCSVSQYPPSTDGSAPSTQQH